MLLAVYSNLFAQTFDELTNNKAKVKTIKIIDYGYYSAEKDKKELSTTLINYDTIGNIIERTEWYHNIFVRKKYLYKYNLARNLIEELEFDESDNLINKSSSTYNDSGNLIEQVVNDLDEGQFSIYKYSYYRWGKQIERKDYTSDTVYTGKVVEKFDSAGNKTEAIYYKTDTNFEFKTVSKFNANRYKIEEIIYYPGNMLFSQSFFDYDKKGNLLKETIYKKDYSNNTTIKEEYHDEDKCNRVDKYTVLYDENGRSNLIDMFIRQYDGSEKDMQHNWYTYDRGLAGIIKCKCFSSGYQVQIKWYFLDGKYAGKFKCKLDDFRNPVEQLWYSRFRKIRQVYAFLYAYDKYKNWINRIDSDERKYFNQTKREIEYY